MSKPRRTSKGKKARSIPAVTVRESAVPLPELGQVEDVLRDLIGRAEEPRQEGPGPRKVLPALCLWGALLVCVLRGFQSQMELWRLLSVRGLWSYPLIEVSDEAVRKRLAQAGGAKAMEKLFEHITSLLAARLSPYRETLVSFTSTVVAIDQLTLDAVMRHLPELRTLKKGDHALLAGQLSACFDVGMQQFRKILFTPEVHQNEKVLAREVVAGLPKGSLILLDLGFFAFELFDWLTGEDYFFVSRMREKTTYTVAHVHYARGETLDALIWLGRYRADRAAHLVRLVQFHHAGKVRRYITNVRDPRLLPLHRIAELYARRWDIEMAIKLVKRELKLHLLWSAKEEVVLQQVWAVLILSQVFQGLRKEIAGKAGVDVFEVSMSLMIRMLPQFACDGVDPVAAFVERGRFGKMIRPARRVQTQAPRIDPALLELPPEGLQMKREARYAHRKCGPRSN